MGKFIIRTYPSFPKETPNKQKEDDNIRILVDQNRRIELPTDDWKSPVLPLN